MSGKILNGDLEVIKASNVEVEVAEEDALKFKNDPPQGNPTVIGKNQGDLSPGQPVEVKWTGRRGG